jgi:predicted DNA-binding protein
VKCIKYSRWKFNEKEVKGMSKFIGIKMSDNDYERLAKLAKIEGKSFSKFVKDKLKDAVMQEMRETNLLERLIKMIENLQNFQPQNTAQGDSEILREIYKLLLFLCQHEKTVAELTILMEQKRKEYMQKRQEIEKRLGLES